MASSARPSLSLPGLLFSSQPAVGVREAAPQLSIVTGSRSPRSSDEGARVGRLPQALRDLFAKMGYQHTATHKTKAIELWQQGDITYVINNEPGSHARRFVEEHGPCAPSMAWRVVDAQHQSRMFLDLLPDLQGRFN